MALRPPTTARERARRDKDRVIDRYRSREPVSRIASDYGVSQTWLRRQLDVWGVPRRPVTEVRTRRRSTAYVFRGRAARPRTRAEVRAARAEFVRDRTQVTARYEAGASATRLAREYGVNLSWLADTFDGWSIPRRDSRRPTEPQDAGRRNGTPWEQHPKHPQEDHTMSTATVTTPVPFGVRHLVAPAASGGDAPVLTYSESLQLSVSADGNPWHALTAEMPETQTETSNGDGNGPGSDSGTDLY
ncbi:hypothetical protein [Streptomyces phytohabitans]|uniref:hypothetical protein n=1 Tax=Streptomyces phytohabitans TaxID=1150371 RepID=UPI00345BDB52